MTCWRVMEEFISIYTDHVNHTFEKHMWYVDTPQVVSFILFSLEDKTGVYTHDRLIRVSRNNFSLEQKSEWKTCWHEYTNRVCIYLLWAYIIYVYIYIYIYTYIHIYVFICISPENLQFWQIAQLLLPSTYHSTAADAQCLSCGYTHIMGHTDVKERPEYASAASRGNTLHNLATEYCLFYRALLQKRPIILWKETYNFVEHTKQYNPCKIWQHTKQYNPWHCCMRPSFVKR